MPNSCDMVVIGGGVIGLSCAWRIARRGLSVTLLERGLLGSGASGASLGVLMPAPTDRDEPIHRLQRSSLASYPDFVADLQEASGIDVGYRRRDILDVFADQSRRDRAASWVEKANEQCENGAAAPVELVEPADIADIEPAVEDAPFGGLLNRSSAQIRIDRLIEALAEACRRAGVRIETNRTVSQIDMPNNRVRSIRCDNESIGCGQVLAAAGAWTGSLSAVLENAAPLQPVRGEAMRLAAKGAKDGPIVRQGSTYIIRDSNEITVGATSDPQSGFDARVTATGIARLTQDALRLMPSLSDSRVTATWAGLRPKSRTGKAIIGRVPGTMGLTVATGHYKIGVCLAPATSAMIADLVTGQSPTFDPVQFAPLPQ